MGIGSIVGAGLGIVGSVIGGNASKKAAQQQQQATQAGIDANERMFERNVQLNEPWRQGGIGALSQLTTGINPNGEFNQKFQFDPNSDPSYQFRLNQGLDAINSNAAARGLLQSGGTLKALSNYGQQAASQEYGNAYNRWNNDVTNRFNRLSSIAGLGQTATRDVSQLGTNSTNASNELRNQGSNAAASGIIGQANAWNSGLSQLGNQLGNWWQNKG